MIDSFFQANHRFSAHINPVLCLFICLPLTKYYKREESICHVTETCQRYNERYVRLCAFVQDAIQKLWEQSDMKGSALIV